MMIDIDALNWNYPNNEQYTNTIGRKAIDDDEISSLILPYRKKECWENCARLLSTIDNSRLIPFLPQILEWYKDMNWPGFRIISERMKSFAAYQISDAVHTALHKAVSENDMEWYENLLCSFPLIDS